MKINAFVFLIPVSMLLSSLLGCNHKKVNLYDGTEVNMKDLKNAFKPLTLPITYIDSTFTESADTTLIGSSVMWGFIPKNIVASFVDGDASATFRPIGKIDNPSQPEVYLLLALKSKGRNKLVCLVFDREKDSYLDSKLFIQDANRDGYVYSLSVNKEPTFMLSKEKTDTLTKALKFTRNGFVFNAGKGFGVIVNDTNEDEKKNEKILNPIDTFPQRNRLSGNYAIDEKNFVSIRDGKRPDSYFFYIHIEKNEGKCVGELKGEIHIAAQPTTLYHSLQDPCAIEFDFQKKGLKIKEIDACGNHRGIDCNFDGTYIRPLVQH